MDDTSLHALARRLIDIVGRIERASSDAEVDSLCNQRDLILSRFRATDRVIASLAKDDPA